MSRLIAESDLIEAAVSGDRLAMDQLLHLLHDHPHVAAEWQFAGQLVNLPPVAYVFTAGKPNGWVLAEVRESRLTLTLRTIDPRHQQHGELVELAW